MIINPYIFSSGRVNIENNGVGSIIYPNNDVMNNVWGCYDFSNLSHYTESGGFTDQVDDISGRGLHATQTGGSRGLYSASVLNGFGGLVLGAGKSMEIGTVSDFKFLSDGSPATVFMVFKRNDSSSSEYLYLWNISGGAVNGIYIASHTNSENIYSLLRNLSGSGNLDNTIATAGQEFVHSAFHKFAHIFRGLSVAGVDREIYIDDFTTAAASTDGLTATIDTGDTGGILKIGGYASTDMTICNLIITNPSLGDINSYISIYENYVLSKYGI
jgi:hypothetical protein